MVRPLLRAALGPDQVSGEVAVEAVNRRGRQITVRVACTPLRGRTGENSGHGAIVVMESDGPPPGGDEV